MNEFVLARANVRVLMWHTALYGLGAILDDADVPEVRLSWTSGMSPRPRVSAPSLTRELVDEVVRQHARARAVDSSWLARDLPLPGPKRGLMSPRHSPFRSDTAWSDVQRARHVELQLLTGSRSWLDLRELAALGEPSYWSRNRKGEALQDDGASRFEMQPRNQGAEIVAARMRKLASAVAAREQGLTVDGLDGVRPVDEAGSGRADSRTPTGLASPGPTDNAVAWCALWGISQLPTAPRVNATAVSSGHVGRSRREWFFAPVWHQEWRPARLRTVLAAQQLKRMAADGLPPPWSVEDTDALAARSWLSARGVLGVMRFPIQRFGSDSAPERRAMLGEAINTAVS